MQRGTPSSFTGTWDPDARSQRAVRAALRLEPRGAPPDSRMRQWSVDWRWVERCRAYDAYTALEGSR